MNFYTTVLLVPPALAVAYGEFYLAHVEAPDRDSAVAAAKVDACEAYGMLRSRHDEWGALIVFAGKHRDCLDLRPLPAAINGKPIQALRMPQQGESP